MAIISQQRLFCWEEISNLGDLERLKLVLETMPDEKLMRFLEKQRGCGRNDYSVRSVWNSILAGIVYQHPSIESLRRDLSRNAQLRFMCGFQNEVPPSWYIVVFLKNYLSMKNILKTFLEH